MAAANRFGQLQKEKPESRPSRRKEAVEDAAGGGPTATGGAPPQQRGGWQVVEPRNRKPQPAPTAPSNGAQRARKRSPKIQREPSEKPPPGQPVGAILVDPEVEKAQKKAALALQRHYAKQQAPQREARGDDEIGRAVAQGKTSGDALTAWLGPELPAAAPTKHRDPHSNQAVHFTKNHADPPVKAGKKGAAAAGAAGGVWVTTAPAAASSQPAPKKGKQQPKGGQQQQKPPPSVAASAAVAASDKIHQHLADGSVVADVSFQFVVQNVTNNGCRTVPLVVTTPAGPGLNPKAFELFAKAPKTVKGGFFIAAERKSWSNESTVDEPWMIDSYFKALLPILKNEATSGVAYPFWPKAEGGVAVSDVEAKVTMKLTPGHATALELEHEEHHCSIKVMTRRAKVSLREFATRLVEEAGMLVTFMAAIAPQLQGTETLKAFPNVERLTAHLDECRAVLGQ